MDEAKPFKIPKREVWEAFKRVKANQGAAGVDGQSIAGFEANLHDPERVFILSRAARPKYPDVQNAIRIRRAWRNGMPFARARG